MTPPSGTLLEDGSEEVKWREEALQDQNRAKHGEAFRVVVGWMVEFLRGLLSQPKGCDVAKIDHLGDRFS